MFEKEAEEYTKNIFCNVNCSIGHPRARSVNLLDVEQAFKDGAEFGYNKANEEFKICEQNAAAYYDKLQKAKEIIKSLLDCLRQDTNDPQTNYYVGLYMTEAEQFISEVEK